MAAELAPGVRGPASVLDPSDAALPPIPVRGLVAGPLERFTLEVSYSIGNVGPGFDRFGLALARPVDRIELGPGPGPRLEVVGAAGVPSRWEENAFGVAFDAAARRLGCARPAVRVRLRKGYRGGSGLGSSGASAAAGALSAALALGAATEDPEVVAAVVGAAGEGEAAVAGTAHFDNVLASLYGGFVHLEREAPIAVRCLRPKLDGTLVVAVPVTALATRASRGVLPDQVPRADAILNLSHAAALVHALARDDVRAAAAHLEDRLAEPYRAALVPGYRAARGAAIAAGAWGVALSGSGPSLFAFAPTACARRVALGLLEGLRSAGSDGEAFLTGLGDGPRLLP